VPGSPAAGHLDRLRRRRPHHLDRPGLAPAAQSLRAGSGGYTPQIVPGPEAVWVLTPSGLARADPATATITAIIHTGFAPSATSASALVVDSAGRLNWCRPTMVTLRDGLCAQVAFAPQPAAGFLGGGACGHGKQAFIGSFGHAGSIRSPHGL